METIVNALSGGFVQPQSGGDPIVNPHALPSGRNTYGINAEATPTREAWRVAGELVDQLIASHREETGELPNKVGFTLWSSEFVRQEGITIAEILHLLGVEPVRNSRGAVHDVKLIPIAELGRPRIDVVVQTSGQFRDLAASRIYLINKAVRLASNAEDGDAFPNRVREGTLAAETVMKEKGTAPAEARELSTIRVFGGLNGSYGTGIMGLVESGDRWEDDTQVADRYLGNMGAMYSKKRWGDYEPGMFEAALQKTDTVLQPRSSNTWGPLSLDHVYEFMGGMNLAVRRVTGESPTAYFSDMRSPSNPTVQSAKRAIWTEARTTVLNPKFIGALQEEGASAAESFAETFRNSFGWDVMHPELIDESLWERYNEVYVEDVHGLGIEQFFREKNPYALQEMTAILLETVRKGHWNASPADRARIAELHADLIEDHGAGCSGFVCDNGKLREMIGELLEEASREQYAGAIAKVREAQATDGPEGVTLDAVDPPKAARTGEDADGDDWRVPSALMALLALVAFFVIRGRRRVA